MSALSLKDAQRFYRRFYAPNNAVLVVAGDVTPEEVHHWRRQRTAATSPTPSPRASAHKAPGHCGSPCSPRTREQAPALLRYYRTPSYFSGRPGQAESIELLSWIVGNDDTSRLYRRLVAGNLASTAGTNFDGNALEGGRLACVLIPLPGITLERVEAELDAIIADVRQNGVTQEELERAKSALEAQRVFESDNQTTLANRYGQGVTLGRSIADRCGLQLHPVENPTT
jgi:zinc protease